MKRALAILILAAGLGLAGCTPWSKDDDDKKFGKCPTVQLLAPARGWIDPPGDAWQTRGQITEFALECKLTKTTADVTITASVHMERSGSATKEIINVPMFVATTRNDEIINKQMVSAPIKFAEGKKEIDQKVEMPVSLPFIKIDPPAKTTPDPAPDDKDKPGKKKDEKPKDNTTAADRIIVIGFQLTPEQLAYFQKLRDAKAAALAAPTVPPAPTTLVPSAHILRDPTAK